MNTSLSAALRIVVIVACAWPFFDFGQAFGQSAGIANVTFQWTDRGGTPHPLKHIWVTGVEDDFPFGTEPAGEGYTLSSGIFVFTGSDLTPLDSQTEFRGDVQSYLGVGATEWARVTTAGGAGIYFQNWPAAGTFNVPDPPGSASFTYTLDNTTTPGKAVQILQAVEFMRRYYVSTHSYTIPHIRIDFDNTIASSVYFDNNRLELGRMRWASWDVIMHEFGHHTAFNNNLDAPFGGDHGAGLDSIDIAMPTDGARTAYGEGVATFLGLLAVNHGNLSALVPGLPARDYDTFYDAYNTPFNASAQPNDTNVALRINAEAKGGDNEIGAFGPNLGEGDEMSVLRVLWDVYDRDFDTYQTGFDDVVEFEPAGTLDLMNGADIFEDFWDNLASATLADPTKVGLNPGDPSPLILSHLGETLQEYNIGMNPLDDFATTNDRTPKLRFIEQNNDRSGDLKFMVWNDDFSQLVDSLAFDDTAGLNTWEWDVSMNLMNGTYHWTALANSAIDLGVRPPSGDHREWYWASMHTFSVIPEPSAMLLLLAGFFGFGGPFVRRSRAA